MEDKTLKVAEKLARPVADVVALLGHDANAWHCVTLKTWVRLDGEQVLLGGLSLYVDDNGSREVQS